jgi:anti-sigma factor RsiW
MTISRDVITDLLPIYLAGEASPGTRALVEDYLRQHPELAGEVRAQAERTTAALDEAASPPPPDAEKATLEKVRTFNRRRSYLLACAIASTVAPLSFVVLDNQLHWIMLRDNPTQAALFWLAAIVCWIGYALLGLRLRTV